MADNNEFDVLYERLFGEPAFDIKYVPYVKPTRKLNALSTATCANCHGAMKMSMVGMIHVKSGNDLCYGINRPDQTGIPIIDESE
jgi:hypothetical protein